MDCIYKTDYDKFEKLMLVHHYEPRIERDYGDTVQVFMPGEILERWMSEGWWIGKCD